ncbi:hypothetical protein, partial [Mycoplasmopsis agassizii]
PYFMSVDHIRHFTYDTRQSGEKEKQDIEFTFENFETLAKWREFIKKVAEALKNSPQKLDAFSNAMGDRLVDEITTKLTDITTSTKIFYIMPYKNSEIVYVYEGDYLAASKTGDKAEFPMVRHTQDARFEIGATQYTLIFSGFQDYNDQIKTNGKPWNKDKKKSDQSIKGNGVSNSYFEIDGVKWWFNGDEKAELLLGNPYPETSGDTPTSDRYQTGLAVAIRFLLEAIITKDTMSRTPVETPEVTPEVTPSEPTENTGESNS